MPQKEIQITQRGLDLSDQAKERIEELASKLEQYDPRMTSCHVVCEAPNRHQLTGVHYQIRIEMGVPGRTLIVTRQHKEDLNAAIRDAFDAARRELEDAVRMRDGRVKEKEGGLANGTVLRVFRDKNYGFIESEDGTEIYFHRNSVMKGNFDELHEGVHVHYAEEMGDKGPQATRVNVVGHP